jgi:hypothetical protein
LADKRDFRIQYHPSHHIQDTGLTAYNRTDKDINLCLSVAFNCYVPVYLRPLVLSAAINTIGEKRKKKKKKKTRKTSLQNKQQQIWNVSIDLEQPSQAPLPHYMHQISLQGGP